MRDWRSKSHKTLFTRPIYTDEFPTLARAMSDDGLSIRLVNKGNGYEWLVADYIIPTKSVSEVWGLTPHQMRRFIAWLLENDSELVQWE
tara:strand:- start:3759 stop:4025 length:267 start_codon:yes stop_codon:yes gene_type:complete